MACLPNHLSKLNTLITKSALVHTMHAVLCLPSIQIISPILFYKAWKTKIFSRECRFYRFVFWLNSTATEETQTTEIQKPLPIAIMKKNQAREKQD